MISSIFLYLLLALFFAFPNRFHSKDYGNYLFQVNNLPIIPKAKYGKFIGDFNGDGIQDFVTENQNKSCLTFFFGSKYWSGAKAFNTSASILTKQLKFKIFGITYFSDFSGIGDYNNDGYDDILIKESSTGYGFHVIIVLGHPAKTNMDIGTLLRNKLAFQIIYDNTNSLGAESHRIGDFNGDRIPDFLISSNVMRQGQNQNAMITIIFGSPHFSESLFIVEENFHEHGITIQSPATKTVTQLYPVSIQDLNRDGYYDLAVGSPSERIVWLVFGHKSPDTIVLESKEVVTEGNGIVENNLLAVFGNDHMFGFSLSLAGDVNGDGLLDLFLLSYSFGYLVLGRKHWKQNLFIDEGLADKSILRYEQPQSSSDFLTVMNCGDLNQDGLSDNLIAFRLSDRAYILFGNRRIAPIKFYDLGKSGITLDVRFINNEVAIHSGNYDFDDDGYPDMLISNGKDFTREITLYFLSGKQLTSKPPIETYLFESHIDSSIRFPNCRRIESVGDFNGDGVQDILCIYYLFHLKVSEVAEMYLGRTMDIDSDITTPSSFIPSVKFYDFFLTISSGAVIDYWVNHEDIDGDGCDDIIFLGFANRTGELRIVFGSKQPSSTVSLHVQDSTVLRFQNQVGLDAHISFSIGDFNGDGISDLFLHDLYLFPPFHRMVILFGDRIIWQRNQSISISSWVERGKGVILDQLVGLNSDRNFWKLISTNGDINRDGCDDILYETEGHMIYYLPGVPDTTSVNSISESIFFYEILTNSLRIMSLGSVSNLGDFNGDGYDDFILAVHGISSYTDEIFIFYGKSNETSLNSLVTAADDKEVPYYRFPSNEFFVMKSIKLTTENFNTKAITLHDLNNDGCADIIFNLRETMYVIYGRKDSLELLMKEENEFRNYRHENFFQNFVKAQLWIGKYYTGEIKYLGDFDNDSIPELSIQSYLIPGKTFVSYFPQRELSSIPIKSRKDQRKEFDSQSFYEQYIKQIIKELLWLIAILITSIVLFLGIIGFKRPEALVNSRSSSSSSRRVKRTIDIEMKTLTKQSSNRSSAANEDNDQEDSFLLTKQ